MDDEASYRDLIQELKQKLWDSHAQFLQGGPLTHVHLHMGTRYLSPEQKEEIKELIESTGNLLVKTMNSDVVLVQEMEQRIEMAKTTKIHVGLIRSGQVLECDRDILILGDINPGGWVISKGNIFVMGSLKGNAHAGFAGDSSKIIYASTFEPIQLRIADVIRNSFNESKDEQHHSQFAYVMNHQMSTGRIQELKQLCPEIVESILKGY
jgi:septum site-determining protein MinC